MDMVYTHLASSFKLLIHMLFFFCCAAGAHSSNAPQEISYQEPWVSTTTLVI